MQIIRGLFLNSYWMIHKPITHIVDLINVYVFYLQDKFSLKKKN